MSWIIPLIIIIASLLLLALIIWGCSQKDRNKRNQYNVAQKEFLIKNLIKKNLLTPLDVLMSVQHK